MKYRLYVDEVGNHDLASSHDPNHRYFSLTGVMVSLDYVRDTLHPEMEAIKYDCFGAHPDNPIIFHRKELASRKYPFNALMNPEVEEMFNCLILAAFKRWEYRVFTVTIDKFDHLERYKVWRYHPYHYCLKIMIERYTQYLERAGATGDVISEARGKKEDSSLKESFERIYRDGSDYVHANRIQARLTSKQLKIEPKQRNIAGLQLADLIAYPSYKCSLAHHNGEVLPINFTSDIARILEVSKYDRHPYTGRVDGWGRKWLP